MSTQPPPSASPAPGPPVTTPTRRSRAWSRGWLASVGIIALSLLMPHSWPGRTIAPWVPGIGLGVALTAWRGYSAALWLIPAGLLSAASACWRTEQIGLTVLLGEGLCHGLLQAAYCASAVATLRIAVPRSADLREPRWALHFVLFPILLCIPFAAIWCSGIWVVAPYDHFFEQILDIGLAQALGFASLAPVLFVMVSPYLAQRGWIGRDGWWKREEARKPWFAVTGRLSLSLLGDVTSSLPRSAWLEVAALGVGTSLLSAVLAVSPAAQAPSGWQLWGAPLLLIVWTAIRQGLAGSSLVVAFTALVALRLPALTGHEISRPMLVQINLVVQSVTGVLVAATVGWGRANEERYRQVVSQIPVVLYSARMRPADNPHAPLQADVLFVNPPCWTVFGCPPDDLLGNYERWLEQVHPSDRELLRAALQQLDKQTQPVVCEYRLGVSPNSSWRPPMEGNRSPLPEPRTRWVRDVMVPRCDSAGRLIGWDGMASDITEQRVLADDLRRTSSMFLTLVGNLPAGVFFVSAKSGRPILVNQRARQLLGQREDAAAALEHLTRVYRLHTPEGEPYPSQELPVYQVQQRGVVSMRDDIVVHRPDGRRIPLISWAAPVDLGQKGKPDAIVWVFEDLSELRQAEAARRETEGRLRTVIASLTEGLVVQDRHGALIDANPSARSILGALLDDPATLPSAGWLHEDGSALPVEEHPFNRVLQHGVPVRNVVLSPPHADAARPRWLLVNALPLAPRVGTTPAGVVTTFVDITDHIHAEHAIRESEERYRGLVDTLPLMVLQFDRTLRLTFANTAMTDISGFSLSEVEEPAQWKSLIHPDDSARVLAALEDVLANGTSTRLECRYRSKDGQEHICYSFFQPLWTHEGGLPGPTRKTISGVTALVVDLTRERRLEQELQRAQRLELIGRLTSGIAHDFNNLLTALLGMIRLAEMKAEGQPHLTADLQRIADVSELATNLAQQILAFTRNRSTTVHRIEANKTIRRIAEILHTLLPPYVKLDCTLNDRALFVLADEIPLQQVVMNLALNARDAMPNGGTLTIRTAMEEGKLLLTVADDGEGMTDEVRARVFEPFFSTKERGTGLGLAVVHRIITSFNGTIDVASQLGHGSRFAIRIPLLDPVR